MLHVICQSASLSAVLYYLCGKARMRGGLLGQLFGQSCLQIRCHIRRNPLLIQPQDLCYNRNRHCLDRSGLFLLLNVFVGTLGLPWGLPWYKCDWLIQTCSTGTTAPETGQTWTAGGTRGWSDCPAPAHGQHPLPGQVKMKASNRPLGSRNTVHAEKLVLKKSPECQCLVCGDLGWRR